MSLILKSRLRSSAFTLIELLATVLITVSLSTLSYVSFNNALVNTTSNTSTDGLTADVKSQQLLAIAGKTDGTMGGSSISKTQAVYFALGTKFYYLFECDSPATCVYSESNSTNIQRSLGGTLIFSNVNLPNNTIIFQPTSGEPYNYSSTQNTLEMTNQINSAKVTFQLNSLGNLVAIYTPPPTGLSPSGSTTTGVHSITWDAVAGYAYAIRVDDQSDGVAWTGKCGALNSGNEPNANDACSNTLTASSFAFNFQEDHTYKIWVHNISASGWSDATSVTVVTTAAPIDTPTPTLTGAPTPTTEPSPIIAYNFNEGTADWIYDQSGNALHSRFAGTPPTYWAVSGKNSGGLSFPVASNNYFQVSSSTLNLNNFTYGMWFKLNDSTGTQWQNILAVGNDSSDRSPGLWLNHDSSPGVDCLHARTNGGNAGSTCVGTAGESATTLNDLSLSTWYHLEVVKSGTTQTVYINGIAVATATIANPMQNSSNPYLRIGGTYTVGFTIDDFRLYNYARSATGVISDRDAAVPSASPVVATYTPTPTNTPTPTYTPTNTPTNTPTPTNTNTPTPYPTTTPTGTPSATANDITVRKAYTTPSTTYVAVGSTVVYNILVTNPAASTYYSRGTFTDTIPTGLSSASWTCAITAAGTTQGQGPVSSCASTSGSGNLSFTLTLNKGATASITISAQVDADAPATITNTASYNPTMYEQTSSQCCCLDFDCQTNWSETSRGAESTSSNNTASVIVNTYTPTPLPTAPAPPFATSTPSPTPGSVANDIYVNKAVTTPNSGFVAKGASVTYMIDVSFPSGSTRVAYATFLDTVSAQITSPTWTCAVIAAGTPVTHGAATSCGGASGSGSINNNIILEPGAKIRFTISGTVSALATGDVSNTGLVINVNLVYYTSHQEYCLDFDCITGWDTNNTGADISSANNSSTVATSTY